MAREQIQEEPRQRDCCPTDTGPAGGGEVAGDRRCCPSAKARSSCLNDWSTYGSFVTALVTRLTEDGYGVKAIARSDEKCAQLIARGVDAKPGDLADLESLKAVANGSDHVIFLPPLEGDEDKLTDAEGKPLADADNEIPDDNENLSTEAAESLAA